MCSDELHFSGTSILVSHVNGSQKGRYRRVPIHAHTLIGQLDFLPEVAIGRCVIRTFACIPGLEAVATGIDGVVVKAAVSSCRSGCTTPASWAAMSPSIISRARLTDSRPSRFRIVARFEPRTCGIVMYLIPSISPMSFPGLIHRTHSTGAQQPDDVAAGAEHLTNGERSFTASSGSRQGRGFVVRRQACLVF